MCASHTLDCENRKYKAAVKYKVDIITREAYERIIIRDDERSVVNVDEERAAAMNSIARRTGRER